LVRAHGGSFGVVCRWDRTLNLLRITGVDQAIEVHPQPRGDDGLAARVRAAGAKHTGFPVPIEAQWDGGSVSEV
jgi:hypothetical protein